MEQQLQSLRRIALAVARPAGPAMHAELVRELADALAVPLVFVAVFEDEAHTRLRTLAAQLEGRTLVPQAFVLPDSPAGRGSVFRYLPTGASNEWPADSVFGAPGLDAGASCSLADGTGATIGLLVALDTQPIAGGDVQHAEALLKLVAGRLAAEIERSRFDDVLRTTALAVSGAGSGSVFDGLVRLLATTLHVEQAFIARHEPAEPETLRVLARYQDGEIAHGLRYAVAGTPCEAVLGQRFRAYAHGLQQLFPLDEALREEGIESYAGFPLMALDARPLGILAVASTRPMVQLERVEAMLKIIAVRAAAELERLAANEALQRSEASYRAIFEAAEDAIFIHHWDSGEILDVNTRACETFGWSREEFSHLPVAELCAGTPPYTAAEALRRIQLAKLDRCPPFEWLSRNKDGSLHWDEVRLKPATIAGRPHVLAFARDITERKSALAALQAQEQKYRAIFDGSVDAMVLWSEALVVVDVNDAFVHTTGMTRDQVIGRPWHERIDAADIERLLPLIRGALAGREQRAIERVSRADGSLFDIELRYLPVRLGEARYALGVGRDVSEQLEHERELVRSAARLGATVEAAFDGVIAMDGEGRIVEFNAAAERVFGHRRDVVLGRKLADVLVPERHRAAHIRGLMNFQRTGSGRGSMIGRLVETTALHADGREIPVEMAISVATVPEGSIFVGHLRDITERRRGDQALRDSEQQYRAIFNASADALVLRAADFSIVDVNATYEAMSGYTRAEVLGVARVLANPPEVMATIRALHERALAGEAVTLETRLLRRDGQSYDLELRGVPIVHRGQPHVLYIGRDITQAKRAERALRDSEEQYRAIFNASADALVLRGADFRAVEVNPAYASMSGFTREEVMAADRVLTQADAAVRERHRAEHELALAGEQLRFEVTATRKDGSTLQAEVRGTPMMYRGQPHVLYAVRDITERNAAERRRVELERQLRQAQKMEAIGQLTGGIAHDFNNILASVIGYLVLAQERAETLADATLARQLGQAHLAADRARELIAQMLAFARRQRGERRVLALPPLLQQTLSLLRATLPSTVSLQVDVPADGLVRTDAPCVEADPVQLEQVLFNLCINARDAIGGQGRIGVQLRAAPAGSTWLCASCRAAVGAGHWVELAVEDDGPGVAPEVVERIFDPFFSTKAPGRGSGMGLAMVHGIVHDHGGHVQLSTAPGGGARFGVWLPLADAAAAQGAAAPDVLPPTAALSGRVLLVEDDRMVGDFLAERLAGWGLQVQLQRDAAAAAAWLYDLSNPVDLLITDQTMPLLTGLQLAERVHARRPQLPIVLVSGNASSFDADELARCGIAAALPKPIDNARLRATLRRLLADAAAERAAT